MNTFKTNDRAEWRKWLSEHFESEKEIWFVFPDDIMAALQAEPEAWKFFQQCSEGYKRIRIAYIDDARKRPEEFTKRLNSFIAKTKAHKLITGYGGIEKYYR